MTSVFFAWLMIGCSIRYSIRLGLNAEDLGLLVIIELPVPPIHELVEVIVAHPDVPRKRMALLERRLLEQPLLHGLYTVDVFSGILA